MVNRRHRRKRNISRNFQDQYFKPRGIPLRDLAEITLTAEELETLRLRYIQKKNQTEASNQMNISQSQYQRDLTHALEKITQALIEGKAIRIH